jgi:hypothetical protein
MGKIRKRQAIANLPAEARNTHAGYGVGAGRSSDLQARSMLSVEFPTNPRFPSYERTVPLWVFVPVYRCGAVPDLHRVPSRRPCRDRHQRTASIYGVNRGVSRLNVGVVLLLSGDGRSGNFSFFLQYLRRSSVYKNR